MGMELIFCDAILQAARYPAGQDLVPGTGLQGGYVHTVGIPA